MPSLDLIEPDRCYLRWNIRLLASVDENAIRDVFIFATDGSNLEISADAAKPAPEAVETTNPAPEADVVGKALARESTVRVPAVRLDRLVNLLGELVMNQSRLSQAAAHVGAPELANPVQEIERLVAALRDDVLGIRMLPIGTIFGRFRRVVHDRPRNSASKRNW